MNSPQHPTAPTSPAIWDGRLVVGFDLETTGVDPDTARIVTAAFVPADPSRRARTWLVNPGVDIPENATAVHGITTAHARAHGQDPATAVAEIAALLEATWAYGAIIAGHNIAYDLTVLDRELSRRLGRRLDVTGTVIDTMLLDRITAPKRAGRRTLAGCAKHWQAGAGKAHTADGDAGTAAILALQIAAAGPTCGWGPKRLAAAQREANEELRAKHTAAGSAPNAGWPVNDRP